MSAGSAIAAKSAANPRQPLSLRELFCLTTLAAMTLAIVLYREWTSDERWLLALSLGSTLLGVLVARMCGRRGWLAGMLGGTVGGCCAAGIIAHRWQYFIDDEGSQWAVQYFAREQIRENLLTVSLTIAAEKVLLAILSAIIFYLILWLTASAKQNLLTAMRRHPYRSALVLAATGVLVAGALHPDVVAHPTAWVPRYFISLQRPFGYYPHLGPEVQVSLSHDGAWVAFRVHDGSVNGGRPMTRVYHLAGKPQHLKLPESDSASEVWSLPQFSCDDDRFAYLAEQYDPEVGHALRSRVQVFDLVSRSDTTLQPNLLGSSIDSLIWLPGRKLILHVGPYGHSILTDHGDRWASQVSEEQADFQPRLGHVLYPERLLNRLVDLQSGSEIASWIRPNYDDERYSRDGRFNLMDHAIYDHQSEGLQAWKDGDGDATIKFRTFTNGGQAVGTRMNSPDSPYSRWPWLSQNPVWKSLA
jgi:hypothetical protein